MLVVTLAAGCSSSDGQPASDAGLDGTRSDGLGSDTGHRPDGLQPDHKGPDAGPPLNVKPANVGKIAVADYDGTTNDLLTAGLGKTGLTGASPTYSSPPTAAELRTGAIYNNYRALVDTTAGGGFGTLFGPNLDAAGQSTLGEGKIAGKEYLAFMDDGSGTRNVTAMVQVPSTFDKKSPCIVTAASSGSRGIYGAVATSGEWGLKRGCAVVYTDKGTGIGLHDLATDTVTLIDGTRKDRKTAGSSANFAAALSDAELAAFNASTPNRLANKHLHSRQNPEKDWGESTLDAIRFGFYVLNEQFAALDPASGKRLRELRPENTIVIATSVSNGAGAAVAAAELDKESLVDGLVASEPNAQPGDLAGAKIVVGGAEVAGLGKTLADYMSCAGVYAPCAILAAGTRPEVSVQPSAAQLTYAQNRCAALKQLGLLAGATPQAQADESVSKVLACGWSPESLPLVLSHVNYYDSLAVDYANAYGEFSVTENLCGYSVAATDTSGAVIPMPADKLLLTFSTNNGAPDSSTTPGLVYNLAPGGARRLDVAASPSTGLLDRALDGILCVRGLVLGRDAVTGAALSGEMAKQAARVAAGIAQVQRTGDLGGRPAIILQGQADALLPINNTGRAYFARNQKVEGASSKAVYYEISNAQHLDVLLTIPSYKLDGRFVPLHYYFVQALDLMLAHLRQGAPLPPSQLVRTTPRGQGSAGANPITTANVPKIAVAPAASDAISFKGDTLIIPK